MSLPLLIFQAGTHGNLLTRCLSIASGAEPFFDPWKKTIGAHGSYANSINKKCHPSDATKHVSLGTPVWCFITVTSNDRYKLELHSYLSAGELGLDLLQPWTIDSLYQYVKERKDNPASHSMLRIIPLYEKNTDGLRELFKMLFKSTGKNGFDGVHKRTMADWEFENLFKFEWFYDTERFVKEVKHLLTTLGYEYKTDITPIAEKFKQKKQRVLDTQQQVEQAFEHYLSGKSHDISNFVVFQQAYLDHLIEEHYNIQLQIAYPSGYPKNTNSIEINEDTQ